jgi:hypothetical protein
MQTIGSRAEVWHGNAHHTSGGLTKKNLLKNKWGRIVSAKKHKTAKKDKRLQKAGFFAKKGAFGVVKRGAMKGGEYGSAPATAMDGSTMGSDSTMGSGMGGGGCKTYSRKGGRGSRKIR